MITFQVEEGKGKYMAEKFARDLRIIHYAVSLGHHQSLIFYLNSKDLQKTSFRFRTTEQLQSWNMFSGEGIFRLSVGLEDTED